MTAFRKFTRPEDRERITRCGGETAAGAQGVNDRSKSRRCWWRIHLGAFDADQILACVLSIDALALRHGTAPRPALVNPIEYSITVGGEGRERLHTYIHTYIQLAGRSDGLLEMKLNDLPQCTLGVTNSGEYILRNF